MTKSGTLEIWDPRTADQERWLPVVVAATHEGGCVNAKKGNPGTGVPAPLVNTTPPDIFFKNLDVTLCPVSLVATPLSLLIYKIQKFRRIAYLST